MCMYVCVVCILLQQHFPAALSSCCCTGFPAAAFYRLSSSLTNQITTSNADEHMVLLYKIPVPGIISTYKVRIVENTEVRLKFNCFYLMKCFTSLYGINRLVKGYFVFCLFVCLFVFSFIIIFLLL